MGPVRGTAKYAAVWAQLAARISTMSVGDRLPPEPELCTQYQISRTTLRRAVEELVDEGLLVREQGRGTFVTRPRYRQRFHESFADQVMGFYRQQVTLGHAVTTRVLGNRVTLNDAAAQKLRLTAEDELIELIRLRWVNGTLHQHSTTWLSASRFPRVLTQDFSQGSLYEFLEGSYAVKLSRNDLVVSVRRADFEIARTLRLPIREPIMVINSTVYSENEEAIAFGITSITPTNSQISISLTYSASS